ncbi:YbaK/EbsC family protein [Mariniluteicoccus flavus]
MGLEQARSALAQHGLGDRVREFATSSATVELAAAAVGCEPARIAKTLSFFVADSPMLVVFAGDARIDNRRWKETFGVKAKMIPAELVEGLIGHGVGGVCPFGVRAGVPIHLDASLRRFATVFPAAGSPNSCVELSLGELELASGSTDWVDVAKLPD